MKWLVGGIALVFIAVIFSVMVYKPSGDESTAPVVVTDNSTKTDIIDRYTWVRHRA